MKYNLFRKGLICAVIFLFVSIGFVSAFNVDFFNNSRLKNQDNSFNGSGNPPVANFTIYNDSMCGVVEFDGSSSYDPDGIIISYEWDFGDGDPDNGWCNYGWAYHQFCGCDVTYNVTLTVTDNEGLKGNITKEVYVVYANYPPPYTEIDGLSSGKPGTFYNYEFSAMYPEDIALFLFVDWGDGNSTGWIGPIFTFEIVTLYHSWASKGNYIIKAKVKDFCREGIFAEFTVTMPKNKIITNSLFLRFLKHFTLLKYLYKTSGE
jgi:hypothetical protein